MVSPKVPLIAVAAENTLHSNSTIAFDPIAMNSTVEEDSMIAKQVRSANGQAPNFKFMVMFIVGVCEITAQLSSTVVGDWVSKQQTSFYAVLPRVRLHQIYISVMLVATFLSTVLPQTQTMLLCYAGLFGLGAGAWQANILLTAVDAIGIAKIKTAFGLMLFFSGIVGQMFGAPFVGYVLDVLTEKEMGMVDAYRLCFGLLSVLEDIRQPD